MDIIKRKRAEAESRKNERLLQAVKRTRRASACEVLKAYKEMLESRMAPWAGWRLAGMGEKDRADWLDAWFERGPATELGDVTLAVKRTRRASARGVLKAHARRPAHVDRAIF